MRTLFAVVLSMLTGIAIGGIAVQRLGAQAKPPAYVIGEIDVADQENYAKEYLSRSQNLSSQMAAANFFHVAVKVYRLEESHRSELF
jgi:hypothetical protein